ncbi:hypothetical protein HYPSUDRAFT_149384 [Hypholoma sublateritium FD-334 SS-4]|uniref:P-loop containing nucleoside triphosphate hydrolase protein n=1 Tax=Hypholoma sublateritium (strain FD-334 SS-4) TaxID=945553 RepID=A0A0D2LWM2_HYPSF|nr:hypothetical protein HYPSUDRAFT_149384 [Hypholoma sublateritium FD-334 SS-4]
MSFSSTASEADLTEEFAFDAQGQIVLILCGLVASGKSTFAEALEQHFPRFRRCNQDDLGDRRRVEQLTYDTLEQGLSVCIDRANFDATQRAHWIRIAREFSGTQIWVIVFDTPYETCAARLQTRTGHPTISSPEQGRSILARFASDFTHPAAREGYDRILYITPADHPSPVYTRADIATVLRRVRDAPPAAQSARQTPRYAHPGPSFSGNPNRGRRGMWHEGRDLDNHYNRVPRGRGGYSSTTGSSSHFRSWQSPPYRGNGVGIHGTGRGALHHTHMGPRNPVNHPQITSQGRGTGEDPFVID